VTDPYATIFQAVAVATTLALLIALWVILEQRKTIRIMQAELDRRKPKGPYRGIHV
jgi:hypothetical protein